jgi:hypothetical protein
MTTAVIVIALLIAVAFIGISVLYSLKCRRQLVQEIAEIAVAKNVRDMATAEQQSVIEDIR